MIPFILSLIFALVALGLIVYGLRKSELGAVAIGAVGLLIAAALFAFSITFTQDRGQAKILVNFDGTVASEKLTPGIGFKAPWQKQVNFDIFAQEVLFAGQNGEAPSYSGGEVNGAEVTASVARGAQAAVDLQVVYSLDPEAVRDVYDRYRDQDRFTRQIVVPTILSTMRDIPSAYTPVEFRGEKRGEASDKLLKAMNDKLKDYGVVVSSVNLQDIRFTEEVENSIKQVEVAQQKEEQAQADLRATEVSAQAQVVEAQAAADANRLLSESLTPQVLEARRIEAMKKGTVYVVPEGSQPLVQTR
jgi:regulator of protease activity HflC (stomatin/prohibitin superfamily)